MAKTFVTKLNAVINDSTLEVFCRAIKCNWGVTQSGDDYACTFSDINGNGRTCILSVKEGDIVKFSPAPGSSSTTVLCVPISELPEIVEGATAAATAPRTNQAITAEYTYTIPAGTKYLVFYRAYSVTESWNTYSIAATKNGNPVRIPALDLW